jgi:hypothetical protein
MTAHCWPSGGVRSGPWATAEDQQLAAKGSRGPRRTNIRTCRDGGDIATSGSCPTGRRSPRVNALDSACPRAFEGGLHGNSVQRLVRTMLRRGARVVFYST